MNRSFISLLSPRACGWCLLLLFAASQLSGCGIEPPAPAAEPNAAVKPPPKKDTAKQHTNRLATETSPYLLLHAHNPVDWYPWGEEALAKAKKENKVIFLSIGYSSCHWCHVMERESFLDKEIAALLNKHFICIKVDREERPDVDSIYMTSLNVFHQLTGSSRGGGWPLSMFLTPEAKPFFGGTYFPARDGDRGAATGFLTVVTKVREAWKDNPDSIKKDAETVTRFTKTELEGQRPDALAAIDQTLVDQTLEGLTDQFDEQYGGFGYDPRQANRPKFPEPSNLIFLLDRIHKTKDEKSKEMLIASLERMAMGGIRDHLGGGFHRYSVDRFWKIPHFEKMLYDNGQLASVYSEAYLLTGRDDFKRIIEEMLDFVLREMTDRNGGFYSALDAESEDEEGKFYRWGKDEVASLLTGDEMKLFSSVYGLNGSPNFEEHYYAPQFDKPLTKLAEAHELSVVELDDRLRPIRAKLLAVRDKRPRPLTDTKILTSWNGLMIRGFADAGRALKEPRYVHAAERAADFVLKNLRTEDGRLLRTYGGGHAKLNAYLSDYAFLVDGLIALYRATDEQKWLDAAEKLTDQQLKLYWDEKSGGFFFTSDDHESLLARVKKPYDGAQPSGNSVAAHNLVYLSQKLKRDEYLEKAEATIRSVSALLKRAPHAAPRMVTAASDFLAIKAPDDADEKKKPPQKP